MHGLTLGEQRLRSCQREIGLFVIDNDETGSTRLVAVATDSDIDNAVVVENIIIAHIDIEHGSRLSGRDVHTLGQRQTVVSRLTAHGKAVGIVPTAASA